MSSNASGSFLRKPEWLKIRLNSSNNYAEVAGIVNGQALPTICSSGRCPNQSECWSRGTATFMVMGDVCTRACRFCATKSGRPAALDAMEPAKIAESIARMALKHAVITSVDRDDLEDGGAGHWAEIVRAVRLANPNTTIELLIPDFNGRMDLLDVVLEAGPDIVGHNIETCRRVTPLVRSRATYDTSMAVLEHISSSGMVCKSGMMVGIGESDQEVLETMRDLRAVGCNILTIGQYLQPSKAHFPIDRYVHPSVFDSYRVDGLAMGFDYVASAPMVRSSYLADKAVCAVKNRIKLSDL